ELLQARHGFAVDGWQRAGLFFKEEPELGKCEQVVRSPSKVFRRFCAFGLIKPSHSELADDRIVLQSLGLFEVHQGPQADGGKLTPFAVHATRLGTRGAEGTDARRHTNDIEEGLRLIATRQNEMEAMAAHQMLNSERRCEFIITGVAVAQSCEEARAVFLGRIKPQVDVFRKGGSAIKDGCLAADQQVLDAVMAKVLEKACDHERCAGRADESASPKNDANAPGASAFARRRPDSWREPHGASTLGLA